MSTQTTIDAIEYARHMHLKHTHRVLTWKQARASARAFVRRFPRHGLQWETWDMEFFLPDGWRFRYGAAWCDEPTIKRVAAFMRYEAEPRLK